MALPLRSHLCYFENYSSDYLEFRVCRPQKPQRENSENSLHEDTVDTLGHLKCDFHCFGRPHCYCYIQHSNQNQSILDPTDRVRALRKLETRRIFFFGIFQFTFYTRLVSQHKSWVLIFMFYESPTPLGVETLLQVWDSFRFICHCRE